MEIDNGKQENEKENQEISDVKQDKKQEKINKKKLAWTPERKATQSIKMSQLQAAGKGYKGKNKTELEPETVTEEEIIINPQNSFNIDNIIIITIIIISIIGAALFIFKTTTIKQEG